MAQESWKEIDETECRTPEAPILCANNCGFFGSAVTNNLCSKCYRDFIMKQQAIATSASPLVEEMPTVASSSVPIDPTLEDFDSKDLKHIITANIEEAEDCSNKQAANRCFLCRKRVGLTGFICRCGGTYCAVHRYSEVHKCSFDYRTAGREVIAKENPVIKAEKIEKI
ncbi:zinc finger A20 and AN1 domain-containing stress-associated protein 9-like [Typha angustifolia]|uniref:zinc finger A20 and AN1 domain-containing stress-associated protein 9-like n=1 Tax=Typha angustifolia TaxID=59011 RepID=UPI003C2C9F14